MSIVRVGLAETKTFADGYDAIFSRKRPAGKKPAARKPAGKKKPARKPAAKKKSAKKR